MGVWTGTDKQGKYELVAPILTSYIADTGPPANLRGGTHALSYFGFAEKVWAQDDSSSIILDFNLHPVANMVLNAFDEKGNLITRELSTDIVE